MQMPNRLSNVKSRSHLWLISQNGFQFNNHKCRGCGINIVLLCIHKRNATWNLLDEFKLNSWVQTAITFDTNLWGIDVEINGSMNWPRFDSLLLHQFNIFREIARSANSSDNNNIRHSLLFCAFCSISVTTARKSLLYPLGFTRKT